MTTSAQNDPLSARRILVTGATSGLGFEAAAQLADRGVGSITITARTADKAATALAQLAERTGADVFDAVVVDVADLASARAAAAELGAGAQTFDGVILNAGVVPGSLSITADGFEECFAATMLGHHVLIDTLITHDRLAAGARVIMTGSEAANNDLPAMSGFVVPTFLRQPAPEDEDVTAALDAFARGEDEPFSPGRQYAGTKAVAALWSAAVARRNPSFDVVTVSPGSAASTGAARHATGRMKMMVKMMRSVGRYVGMDQPISQAAGRYVEVILGDIPTRSGGLYTSPPKKMVGPLTQRHLSYVEDPRLQDLTLSYLDAAVGVATP